MVQRQQFKISLARQLDRSDFYSEMLLVRLANLKHKTFSDDLNFPRKTKAAKNLQVMTPAPKISMHPAMSVFFFLSEPAEFSQCKKKMNWHLEFYTHTKIV